MSLRRKQVFNRDQYRCRQCGKPGRLEADHVTPLSRNGDAWDLSNIQSLCIECHLVKSKLERAVPQSESRKAWAVYIDELSRRFDGQPV